MRKGDHDSDHKQLLATSLRSIRAFETSSDFRDKGSTSVIFIFGSQKSGTSWLRNIAAKTHAVNMDAEFQLPKYMELTEYHINQHLNAPASVRFDVAAQAARSGWAAILAARVPNCRMDKSAYPSLGFAGLRDDLFSMAVEIKKLLFPDSIQIGIVRDPRDVFNSAKHFWDSSVSNDQLASFMQSWATNNFHWLRSAPTHIVRYEDLHRDFDASVRAVYDALGTHLSEKMLKSIREELSGIEPSQNINALHYRKGVVGDWRDHLTDDDNAVAIQIAGDVMKLFGYTPEGVSERPILDPLAGCCEIPLRDLAEGLDHSLGSASLKDQLAVTIGGEGFGAALPPTLFRCPPRDKKILVVLTVRWADRFAGLGRKFSSTIVRADGTKQTIVSLEANAITSKYGAPSHVVFEFDHALMASLSPEDRINLGLFNNVDSQPVSATIESCHTMIVANNSRLGSQIGQTVSA